MLLLHMAGETITNLTESAAMAKRKPPSSSAHANSPERIADAEERATALALKAALKNRSDFCKAWHEILPIDLLDAGDRYAAWSERGDYTTINPDRIPGGEHNIDAALTESILMQQCERAVNAEYGRRGFGVLTAVTRAGHSPTAIAAAYFQHFNRAELAALVNTQGDRRRDIAISYAREYVTRVLRVVQDTIEGRRR